MTKTEQNLLIFLLELYYEEITYMSCDEVEMDFSQDVLDWLVEHSDESDEFTEEDFIYKDKLIVNEYDDGEVEESFRYEDKIVVSIGYLLNMITKKLKDG